MSDARIKRSSGATTVIKNGRIVGNLPGPSANAPTPTDEAVLSHIEIAENSTGGGADVVVLHDLYAAKASVRTDGDFLAPSNSVPMEIGAGEDGISNELFLASESILSTFGVSAPGERARILTDSTEAIGVHRDTRLLPPDEAAMEVSLAMNMQQESTEKQEAFLERIRRGELALTVSEVAVLHNMRDELLASRAARESATIPFDEDGVWSPPYANRHCTLCGKFVGELGSHVGSCGPLEGLYTEYAPNPRLSKGTATFFGRDGVARKDKFALPALAKSHADLPIDKLQDAYLASSYRASSHADSPDSWICRAIIGNFVEKPLFGEARLALPKELREAYLAGSNRLPTPSLVAQIIDPPFTPGELEHLIDTDRSKRFEGTKQLLDSPRARTEVLKIMENSPSKAGEYLASFGHLPVESVRNMAVSGDATVRMQATKARNLPPEEALRLATDPDPDIRRGMLRRIADFPEMLQVFINDPDEEIAIKAIAFFPEQRQAAVAISKVTSRKRLQAIHDKLPDIWIPAGIIENSQPNDPHPRVKAVNSTQKWIRARLDQA